MYYNPSTNTLPPWSGSNMSSAMQSHGGWNSSNMLGPPRWKNDHNMNSAMVPYNQGISTDPSVPSGWKLDKDWDTEDFKEELAKDLGIDPSQVSMEDLNYAFSLDWAPDNRVNLDQTVATQPETSIDQPPTAWSEFRDISEPDDFDTWPTIETPSTVKRVWESLSQALRTVCNVISQHGVPKMLGTAYLISVFGKPAWEAMDTINKYGASSLVGVIKSRLATDDRSSGKEIKKLTLAVENLSNKVDHTQADVSRNNDIALILSKQESSSGQKPSSNKMPSSNNSSAAMPERTPPPTPTSRYTKWAYGK